MISHNFADQTPRTYITLTVAILIPETVIEKVQIQVGVFFEDGRDEHPMISIHAESELIKVHLFMSSWCRVDTLQLPQDDSLHMTDTLVQCILQHVSGANNKHADIQHASGHRQRSKWDWKCATCTHGDSGKVWEREAGYTLVVHKTHAI
jgi:hypothetical protein